MHLFKREIPNDVVLAGALVLIIGSALTWYYGFYSKKQTPPTPIVKVADKPVVHETPKLTGPSAAQLALATIHKGEGIEHALIRQLVDNPGSYGYTGDENDAKAVKRWAGHEAHVLAVKGGYYEWKFGAEVRVKVSDKVAYVLQENADGDLQVAEYTTTSPPGQNAGTPSGNGTFSLATTHTLAPTIAASQFTGASPKTGDKLPVPPYEYVYMA
jgi:hypothetical protein